MKLCVVFMLWCVACAGAGDNAGEDGGDGGAQLSGDGCPDLVGALEQPSVICIPTYRHFENPFENAHWRKVRQMQPVRLCFLLYKRFEQTFDNTQ